MDGVTWVKSPSINREKNNSLAAENQSRPKNPDRSQRGVKGGGRMLIRRSAHAGKSLFPALS